MTSLLKSYRKSKESLPVLSTICCIPFFHFLSSVLIYTYLFGKKKKKPTQNSADTAKAIMLQCDSNSRREKKPSEKVRLNSLKLSHLQLLFNAAVPRR